MQAKKLDTLSPVNDLEGEREDANCQQGIQQPKSHMLLPT
jgi:hypothetical protein